MKPNEASRRPTAVATNGDPGRTIESKLRALPAFDPPESLESRIMARVPPRRWSWLARLRFDLGRPRTITVRPLRWAPALAVLCACILVYPAVRMATRTGAGPGAGSELITLSFALNRPDAQSVALVGTFNDWRPDGHRMVRSVDERTWTIRLQVPAGRYEYAFLVDGRFVVGDPNAVFRRTDGFGTYNAVVFAEPERHVSL